MCCAGILRCGIVLVLSIVAFGGGFYIGWWGRDYRHTQKHKNKSPPAPASNTTTTRTSSSDYSHDAGLFTGAGQTRDMPSFYHYDRVKYLKSGRDDAVSHHDKANNPMHDVVDFSSSEWYQIERDSIEVTPDMVTRFLEAVHAECKVDTAVLAPYAADLPMYLRSTAIDIMRALRYYASHNGKLPKMSEAEKSEFKSEAEEVLTVKGLMTWLQRPMRTHEAILAPQATLQPSHVEAARQAFSRDYPEVLLSEPGVMNPAQQIVNHAERMRTYVSHRRSSYRRRLAEKMNNMPTHCIGIVVHVLQYSDSQGYRAPLNTYSQGEAPILSIIKHVNHAYQVDNIPIQLHLHQYRSDPGAHPYLMLLDIAHWQDCLSNNKSCLRDMAREHNAEVTEYINIYTLGSSTLCENCCYGCPWGYSSVTPTGPQVESESAQYIALNWDVVDPAVGNNDKAHQQGAATLIQELGHYLGGLLHTHQGGCNHQDLVLDTPPEKPMYDSDWFADLKAWCVEQRRSGDLEGLLPGSSSKDSRLSPLKAFNSCGEANPYSDNVMNHMSYAPHECHVQHSLGQVQQYISMLWYTRPKLLANSQCYSNP